MKAINNQSLDATIPSKQTEQAKAQAGFWRMARNNVRLLHQTPPIQKAQRDLPLPLSFNQERLWKLEQLQPGTSVHNLLHSFHLVGQLNLQVLEQALNEIVRRHECLRTIFTTQSGQPIQIIVPEVSVKIHHIDLRQQSNEQQQLELERWITSQAERPFDLNQAPLWRFTLLRLADQEHVLLRTIHHIVFDGISHSVFMRELGILYSAFMDGQLSPLLNLPVQYADYAWTQRQWLQGELLDLHLDYWQQHFNGTVPALQLPTDFPRSAAISYRGAYESKALSPELIESLKTFSAKQGVSLFVTLFTGFNILLHQYTGQEDMVICSPIAGRHRSETRGLMGFFNNVVALRSNLSANPTLSELLKRVSQCFMEASNYQEVPLQLVAELPTLVRTPLTRAMFVLQNTATPSLELDELQISSIFVDREIANFDLSLSIHEKPGQLTAVFQYKVDLFKADTIAQMMEEYIYLLEDLINKPEQRLSDRSILRSINPSDSNSNHDLVNAYVAPRNNLEQSLVQIWQTAFKVQEIGITDNFFTLGGHSLLAVQILTAIEERLDRKLPITTLLQFPTIAALSEIIQNPEVETFTEDLVPLKVGGNKPPLFCMYGILLYQDLASHLAVDQPVYGIYLREEVELLKTGQIEQFQATFSSVQAIAARYLESIQKLQPHGPYYLCGESFGGLVAYEMAQQLQLAGEEVALVALFDSLSAHYYSQELDLLSRLSRHRELLFKHGISYLYEKAKPYKQKIQRGAFTSMMSLYRRLHPAIAKIPPQSQFKRTLAHNHQWVSTPDGDIQPPVADVEHQDIRDQARRQLIQNYISQPYAGKMLLFRATERDLFENVSYDLGWGKIAGQNLQIFDVPGDHIGILMQPNVQVLAHALQTQINTSLAQPTRKQTERTE